MYYVHHHYISFIIFNLKFVWHLIILKEYVAWKMCFFLGFFLVHFLDERIGPYSILALFQI